MATTLLTYITTRPSDDLPGQRVQYPRGNPQDCLVEFYHRNRIEGPPNLRKFAESLYSGYTFVIDEWSPEDRAVQTGITWKEVLKTISTSNANLRVHVKLDTYLKLCSNCEQTVLTAWFGDDFNVAKCDSLTVYQRQVEEIVNQYGSDEHQLYHALENCSQAPQLYDALTEEARRLLARLPINNHRLSKNQKCLVRELEKLGFCSNDDSKQKWVCFSPAFGRYVQRKDQNFFSKFSEWVKSLSQMFVAASMRRKLAISLRYGLPIALLLCSIFFWIDDYFVLIFSAAVSFATLEMCNIWRMYKSQRPILRRQLHFSYVGILLFLNIVLFNNYVVVSEIKHGTYGHYSVDLQHRHWISPSETESLVKITVSCRPSNDCAQKPEDLKSIHTLYPADIITDGGPDANNDGKNGTYTRSDSLVWASANTGPCPDFRIESPSSVPLEVGRELEGGPVVASKIDLFPQNIYVIGPCLARWDTFLNLPNSVLASFAALLITILLEALPYGLLFNFAVRGKP